MIDPAHDCAAKAMVPEVLYWAKFWNLLLKIEEQGPSLVSTAIVHHDDFMRYVLQAHLDMEMFNR